MLLYHGSPQKIIGAITPHTAFSETPYVYATSDYNYALVRCGKFNYKEVSIREEYDGATYTMCELKHGAFKEIKNRPKVFKLIYFEDDQSAYWASVSGGKAGYIERRLKRIADHNAFMNNNAGRN